MKQKETITKVATELFQRYKEMEPKVWFMQSLGGEPFRIRWVRGKGKPRLQIEMDYEDGKYIIVSPKETIEYTEEEFHSESLYGITQRWLGEITI
jgi:hypothetical protein